MKKKLTAALVASLAVSVLALISGPLRSQGVPNRPAAVEAALWVPISDRVGIELVEGAPISQPASIQAGHLWVYADPGMWRRVQLVRAAQAMRLRP
jgi:hypothetical protein